MDLMLAGPVRWILDLPAFLSSPEVVRLVPAISEAEVAVSVSPAGEVSTYRGAVGLRLAALEDRPPRSLRAIELYMHDATALSCTVEWFCHH